MLHNYKSSKKLWQRVADLEGGAWKITNPPFHFTDEKNWGSEKERVLVQWSPVYNSCLLYNLIHGDTDQCDRQAHRGPKRAEMHLSISPGLRARLTAAWHGQLRRSTSHLFAAMSFFFLMYDHLIPSLIAFQKQSKLMRTHKGQGSLWIISAK